MENCSSVTTTTATAIAHPSESSRSIASIAPVTDARTSRTVLTRTSVLTWFARWSTTRRSASAPGVSSLTMPSTRAREIGASADSIEPSRPDSKSAATVTAA